MRKAFRKSTTLIATMCLLWITVTGVSYADLHIVQETDGHRTEAYFKQYRLAQPMDDGGKTLLFCETGEVVVLSSPEIGRYWRGDFNVFLQLTDTLLGLDDDDDGAGDMASLGGLLGALFGGSTEPEPLGVRVSKSGEQTINGYATEHYVVETGRGNNWQVYEELWTAKDLMGQITAEIGDCVDMMVELVSNIPSLGVLGGLFGMDEMEAVLASPDYLALLRQGHPVRTKTTIRGLFGQTTQTTTEIVDVSSEAIAEDVFAVPAGYTRVDSLMEVYGM